MGIKRSREASVSSPEDPASPFSREHSVDVKLVHLDADLALSNRPAVMRCSLPPHEPLSFDTFEAYDVHYQKVHVNRCSECQKNFPDEYFLNLHIAENHDPINAAKRDNGEKTYACLVQGCDRFCSTAKKRRLHCIDKHHFPRDYDFFVVNDGIDRRSSMLRPPNRRRSSAMSLSKEEDSVKRETLKLRGRGGFGHARGQLSGGGRGAPLQKSGSAETSTPIADPDPSDPMDHITSSMSALQFIPHSVRVARGRGRGRGG